MKLLLSILLAGLLGILVLLGSIGIYIICAIIVGVIFRSFILINEIHKQVVPANSNDRVGERGVRKIYKRERRKRNRKLMYDVFQLTGALLQEGAKFFSY